jgi:DNA polymerase I-like protein with 3'-5' exonuclease and polymerase domains
MKGFIEYLRKEIIAFKPNIIVALGTTALYTLTGIKGIQQSRGYITECTLVPGVKVLPTYHPQAVGYTWNLAFQVVMDLRKALANSATPDLPKDDRVLQSSISKHEYLQYLEWLLHDHKGAIAVDIETASPGSHIDIMGIADSPKHAVAFEFIKNRKPIYCAYSELEIWQSLARVLSEKDLIMQNAPYDITVLWHNNKIFCKNLIADTMIATHICWPEVPRSLGFQASICLAVPSWKHLQFEAAAFYNASDAANTYGIWEFLKKELEKLDQVQVFEKEMAQIHPSIMLQIQGLYVDNKKRLEMEEEIELTLKVLEEQLEEEIGRKINFGSYKQLQQLLFIDMGLPIQFKRRKSINDPKKMTSDNEALKKLFLQTGNPLLEKIMKVKKFTKLLTSFINITTSPQSRVHTSYNITGVTSQRQKGKGLVYEEEGSQKSFGRWSSSKSIIFPYGSGNLQNIPKAARVFYTAGEGKKFLAADYIQAEAVVTAHLSNDHKLKRLFKDSFGATKEEREKNNWDVHKLKASEIFRIPVTDITPEQRRIGKTIRHARNYAAGPGVLANMLGIKLGKAKALIKTDKETCPQLELWHLRIQNELRKTRTLTNLLGRKHRFLDRWPKPGEDGPLFRSAYSYIPQSSVGDLLNQSLVRLYTAHGDWLDIVLQLHDALYCIVDENRIQEAAEAIKEAMLFPLYYKGEEFTIDISFECGGNWGEMKEINL